MAKDHSPSHTEKQPTSPAHFEVTLTADINAISPVVDQVMRMVSDMGYASEKNFQIEMALREALANAIQHGCNADPSKKVQCSVTANADQSILIVVRDPGAGFDPAKLPSPTENQNLYAEGGRGIYLINKLMDEVRFERNGSEIQMRKY